ncbi:MAG: hypothetical protein WBN81_01945 [Gammaproteobacteria bacterium]
MKKSIYMAVLMSALSVTSVESFAGELNGTGDNYGSGWRSDSSRNFNSTRNNFGYYGYGYRNDSTGNLRGTGGNFGSGWRSDSSGNLQETGGNFVAAGGRIAQATGK